MNNTKKNCFLLVKTTNFIDIFKKLKAQKIVSYDDANPLSVAYLIAVTPDWHIMTVTTQFAINCVTLANSAKKLIIEFQKKNDIKILTKNKELKF